MAKQKGAHKLTCSNFFKTLILILMSSRQPCFFAPSTANIDHIISVATVSIPSFIPINQLAPSGATHIKLVIMAVEIDYATGNAVTFGQESAPLTLNGVATAALNLEYSLPVNSLHSLFLVLGIQFYKR